MFRSELLAVNVLRLCEVWGKPSQFSVLKLFLQIQNNFYFNSVPKSCKTAVSKLAFFSSAANLRIFLLLLEF